MSPALSWIDEPMEEHLRSMLELWDRKYSKYYSAALHRLFKPRNCHEVDKIVSSAIILHDVGKLTHNYQAYLKMKEKEREGHASLRYYRHEFISAAVSLLVLERYEWRYIVSGAIILHHEPILMGQTYELGERYVTLTRIFASLREASVDSQILLDPNGVGVVNALLRSRGFSETVCVSYRVDRLEEALKDLVVRIAYRSDRHTTRIKVAALTHILTLIDSLAAKKRSNDEGGTFVSRRASKAEVAELCMRKTC